MAGAPWTGYDPRSQPRWVEAMKKPSRAGGKRAKALPRNALKPRGRNAPKPQSNRRSAADNSDSEVARLKRELREALEQQTATSEVLQVISSSLGDLEPVFAAMLEKAVRICDARFGNIYRWDGEALHLATTHNAPPAYAEERRRVPHYHPSPKIGVGRMVATKKAVHVVDAAIEPAYIERHPAYIAAVELGSVRTYLTVPMLKDNELISAFSVFRQEVRPIAALDTSVSMLYRVRKQLVEEGFEAVLSRKQRATPAVARIFDGEKEAKLIALACSKPPKGRARWTLRLLENKVVELGIVDRASDSTIQRTLKKTVSNRIAGSAG